jgi:hypothetical protein
MSADRSRREFLIRGAALGISALSVEACTRKADAVLACNDTTGLSPENLAARTAAQYVDIAPDARATCTNCDEFVPAGAMPWGRRWPPPPLEAGTTDAGAPACGRCKVIMGPIHPNGHCRLYRPKH